MSFNKSSSELITISNDYNDSDLKTFNQILKQSVEADKSSSGTIDLTQDSDNDIISTAVSEAEEPQDAASEGLIDFLEDEDIVNLEFKRNTLRNRIAGCKYFYTNNKFDNHINLNNQSYKRFGSIKDFGIGYKYQNLIDKMDKIELMCQLVAEREKIQEICQSLYYREASLHLTENENNKLLLKYIGGKNKSIIFRTQCEEEVKEYLWFLKVYRNRLVYIRTNLLNKDKIDIEVLKSIKSYDDVYDYFIKNM